MSLYQGLLGAQVELAGISSPVQKLHRIATISKLFASELVSTVALAPFAVRALRLHKSLPAADSYSPADQQPVYVVRDARYAEAPRALVDLYLPTEAAAAAAAAANPEQQQQVAGHAGNGSSCGRGVPVVVFVHGGTMRPWPTTWPGWGWWPAWCSTRCTPRVWCRSWWMKCQQRLTGQWSMWGTTAEIHSRSAIARSGGLFCCMCLICGNAACSGITSGWTQPAV
ncbi:hypothetical protein COO60DRAFT_431806 [Scenedesmus sp. NREL 46B-D3]|nr:hypothetical protein COO60DRAFT_431806 [Scenedesmus sp. NREL 46B-D3]